MNFAYGHLLFNDRQQKAAGFCREFKIHWEMPAVSCLELARKPQDFLEKNGLADGVNDVLERYATLEYKLGSEKAEQEFRPSRAITFQCLNFTKLPQGVETQTFALSGKSLDVSQVSLIHEDSSKESKLPKKVVMGLAKSLVPHFNYSTYYSNQKTSSINPDDLAEEFKTQGRSSFIPSRDFEEGRYHAESRMAP